MSTSRTESITFLLAIIAAVLATMLLLSITTYCLYVAFQKAVPKTNSNPPTERRVTRSFSSSSLDESSVVSTGRRDDTWSYAVVCAFCKWLAQFIYLTRIISTHLCVKTEEGSTLVVTRPIIHHRL